jgi:sortase A
MRKSIERSFWLVAAICFSVYGLSVAETRLYQAHLERRFTETLPHAEPPLPAVAPAAAAALNESKAGPGQIIGRLEIPSIDLTAIIEEGADMGTLRRSIGHIPGTALPGGSGNVALSAHRDTFFRRLGQLRRDDVLWITTAGATFYYVVESTGIVDPDEAIVLRDIGRPTLTLVTCYPFYYVGPAPKRYIVHARLLL